MFSCFVWQFDVIKFECLQTHQGMWLTGYIRSVGLGCVNAIKAGASIANGWLRRASWRWSTSNRSGDFSIKRWWAFLWLFFFFIPTHTRALPLQKVKLVTLYWPPRRPAGRQEQLAHTHTAKMLPIRQRHSNELAVIVRKGAGGEVGCFCGISFALRFIGLPPHGRCLAVVVVPIFSVYCQSNHI